MITTVEDGGPCRKIMHVEAGWDEFSSDYADLVGAYRKVAKVPGFRKGKAPEGVVEQHYVKEILEDAKERLLPKFYQEAIKKEGFEPLAVVEVEDMDMKKNEALKFKVTFDIAPVFKLPKYKKISLKRESTDVSDKQIDESLDILRERQARFEDVTGRNVKEGDLAKIDYSGECDGVAVKEMGPDCAGLGESNDFWALVGHPEFLPGMVAGLKGMAVGEEKKIDVEFPDSYHVEAVKGKKAVYTVTVSGIREKTLPEMDEEFLKSFEVASAEELRTKVADDLQASAENSEQERLKSEITKFLLEKANIEAPQALVDGETRRIFHSMARNMLRQGVTHDQMVQQQDRLVAEASRAATDRVKLSFILNQVAEAEEISVSEDDVESRIQATAQQYGMPPERFKGELEKRDEGLENLKDELKAEKTIDFLLENAKIKK
ncbi:MAG: trigger factor [Kiritimatiellia bacterium]|jgi:trigger factor|nr:trigger factor [Kiritimatiellia bacterium]